MFNLLDGFRIGNLIHAHKIMTYECLDDDLSLKNDLQKLASGFSHSGFEYLLLAIAPDIISYRISLETDHSCGNYEC